MFELLLGVAIGLVPHWVQRLYSRWSGGGDL